MKKLSVLFTLVAILTIASFTANAQQVKTTATASATIITPLTITKNTDMNFGDLAVNNSAGTVILATDNSRSRTGGVTLPVLTGTVSAAQFTVTGTAGYAYTFSLPVAATTVSNGTQNMTVDNWTSDATGTLTGGTQIVKVGATLNVGANQAAGVYTSTVPFEVAVNYN